MYIFLYLGIFLLSDNARSQSNCDSKNINEFYVGLQRENPIKEQIEKRAIEAETSVDIAKQRPNPVFDLEYLKGNQFGIDINSLQISAQHIFEFGSKRSRRIDEALLSANIQKKQLALKGIGTNVDYLLKYQRVAQLNIVIEAVKEAITTFDGAVNRLQSRTSLNPEERVSLSTLRLAASDYRARLNDLENEQTIISGDLSFISECEGLKPVYSTLNYKQLLPSLNADGFTENGLIQIENLKMKHSEAELDVQKSLGYSNIAIGPRAEYQTQGNDKFLAAGVALTFDIPLFQTNDGGKMNAYKRLVAQKIESTNTKKNLQIKQTRLFEKYKRSVDVLSRMTSLDTLHKQHNEIEKLFSRGIVSIPMTIEAHRQHIDFLQSRFETENDLLVSIEELIFIQGNPSLIDNLFSTSSK